MGDFNFDRRGSRGRFDRPSGGSRFGGRDRERGRDRRSGGFEGRDRRPDMHSAICDKCGKDCEVPFRPTEGKPIYCDDCFKSKSREAGSRSEFGRPNNNENIDQINKKLDKIIRLLGGEKEPVKEKQESKKPKSLEKDIEEELPYLEEPKSIEKPKKKKAKKKK